MHGLVQKILRTCERVANKFLHPGANYTYMYKEEARLDGHCTQLWSKKKFSQQKA